MKIKLDENLGRRGVELFVAAGYDVATVFDQRLSAADDVQLLDVCRAEGRCVVSLDLDFANPLRFVPSENEGIAVLRLPPKPSLDDMLATIGTLITHLEATDIRGRLWIVEVARVREYQPAGDDDS